MSGLFGNLGFNFDTSKFGDAQYLSVGAQRYLNAAPLVVSSWVQADLANNDVAITNYYKNPQANVCTMLMANSLPIYTFAMTHPFDFAPGIPVANSAYNLYLQIPLFKSHTDNISGSVAMTSNQDTIPSLDTATSIGNYLLRILSTTDGLSNTTPMLGSLTSLFINDDLVANSAAMYNDYIKLNSSVAPNGNCWISSTELTAINTRISNLNNYITLRRTSDWSFFANARSMVINTINLSKFDNLGNTQSYLIDNLIGTDRLKQNLAS